MQLERVGAAAVVCDSFLHRSASTLSIEDYGTVSVLQFAVAYSTPSIKRAAFIAACAERGLSTVFILAEGHGIGTNLPDDQIVVVTDHINFMGDNPLIGPNDSSADLRFPDMSEPFSRRLTAMIDGRYAHGPCVYASLPRDRELDLDLGEQLLRFGVNVVGTWIGPELLCARQRSMKVLAFAAPTSAHYGAARLKVSDGLYYSQFREVVALLMQLYS
ncbi:MAG: hypothetical protein IT366_24205 [Candidatus Hydrogenedentes bacterium]|nr:hypothetical protein [Candidatus Hydrogenedentota bacterium]